MSIFNADRKNDDGATLLQAAIAETAIEFREELAEDEEAVLAMFMPIEDDSCVSMTVEEVDELGSLVAERSEPREASVTPPSPPPNHFGVSVTRGH